MAVRPRTLTRYVALLRGINVSGRNIIKMAELEAMVLAMGFTGVETLLQSGNLVFDAPVGNAGTYEERLEAETRRQLGVTADYMVRTASEWEAIVTGNPFVQEAAHDPARLVVITLKTAVGADAFARLSQAITGREVIEGRGAHVYAVYPDGQGDSKLTNALIERQLGARATARNWNTVLKLAVRLGGPARGLE